MLALFGGSFDPIHLGHLNTVNALLDDLDFDALKFIPCGSHALGKEFTVGHEHRLAMLEMGIAALSNANRIDIDLREVQSSEISYTVDTCLGIREELSAEQSISLVVGHDVLGELHRWDRWQSLLDYVNIIVIYRPQNQLDKYGDADSERLLLQNLLESQNAVGDVSQFLLDRHMRSDSGMLRNCPSGRVICRRVGDIAISSSEIRVAFKSFWKTFLSNSAFIGENSDAAGHDKLFWPAILRDNMSDSVRQYIFDNELYR